MGCLCAKEFNVGDRITLIDKSDGTLQPAKVISSSSTSIKIRYLKYQESAFDETIKKSEWEAREVTLNTEHGKVVKHYKQSIDQSDLSKVKEIPNDYKFTLNQEIKVKDLSAPNKKFRMARVIKVNRKSIKIHWIGEQSDFDEVIKKDNNYDNRIIILTEQEIAQIHVKSESKVEQHFNKEIDDESKYIEVDFSNYKFIVGQKVKCKDLSHPMKKYNDARIVKVWRKSIKIHWIGEQDDFDETIKRNAYSDRIKILKSDDNDEHHNNDDERTDLIDEDNDDDIDYTEYEFNVGQKIKCKDLSHPKKIFADAKIVKVNKKDIKIHWIGEQDNFDETIKKTELKGRIKIIDNDDDAEPGAATLVNPTDNE